MKLNLNCNVEYLKSFISEKKANNLYTYLVNLKKLNTLAEIETFSGEKFYQDYGKLMFITKNLFDKNKFDERIWGNTMVWPNDLLFLKEKIEHLTNIKFDVGVCIYYPNGNSGVDYHSDYIAFGDTTIIPSISLGEIRQFNLREKQTLKEHKINLNNGSLIIMGENCQELYEHSLPVNENYKNGRINITFRKYGFN